MSVSFEFGKDWNKTVDRLEVFTGALDDVWEASLRAIADVIIVEINLRAPRKTSKYANSWDILELDSRHVVVGIHDEELKKLAIYLEFRTQPHTILPVNKTVLRWVDSSGIVHFATIVFHPGTAPIPHIRPAIELARTLVQEIFLNKLKTVGGLG